MTDQALRALIDKWRETEPQFDEDGGCHWCIGYPARHIDCEASCPRVLIEKLDAALAAGLDAAPPLENQNELSVPHAEVSEVRADEMPEHEHLSQRAVPAQETENREEEVNAHTLTLAFGRFLTESEWRAVVEQARQVPHVTGLTANAVLLDAAPPLPETKEEKEDDSRVEPSVPRADRQDLPQRSQPAEVTAARKPWAFCKCGHGQNHHAYPGTAGTPCTQCGCQAFRKCSHQYWDLGRCIDCFKTQNEIDQTLPAKEQP